MDEQSLSMVVITDPIGNIEYVNQMFTAITGYSAEEMKGINLRIRQSGVLPIAVYKDLWETILSGRIWRGKVQNRKKNGVLYWERIVLSPILHDDVITHVIAEMIVITEQNQ